MSYIIRSNFNDIDSIIIDTEENLNNLEITEDVKDLINKLNDEENIVFNKNIEGGKTTKNIQYEEESSEDVEYSTEDIFLSESYNNKIKNRDIHVIKKLLDRKNRIKINKNIYGGNLNIINNKDFINKFINPNLNSNIDKKNNIYGGDINNINLDIFKNNIFYEEYENIYSKIL